MADQAVDAYIQATGARLAADGCEVRTEDWHGTPVLVGYRADFRLRWMATKLHLLTVVAPASAVTQHDMETFTNTAFDYAQAQKGQLRGLQSGVAVFPALVGTHVDPAATAWVAQKQLVRFGSVARPVAAKLLASAASVRLCPSRDGRRALATSMSKTRKPAKRSASSSTWSPPSSGLSLGRLANPREPSRRLAVRSPLPRVKVMVLPSTVIRRPGPAVRLNSNLSSRRSATCGDARGRLTAWRGRVGPGISLASSYQSPGCCCFS